MVKNKANVPEATRIRIVYLNVSIGCVHSGKPRTDFKTDNSRKTNSMKIECLFEIYLKYVEDKNCLEIKKVNLKHNHGINEC